MATLKLTMLNSFGAAFDDRAPIGFRSDKVRALLAYLAIESDRPHTRAELCGLLWPEYGDSAALHNLSQTLLRLREALAGTADPASLLLTTRQAIQWNPAGPYQLDVASFSALAHSDVMAELERAVELYAGPLLPGFGLPGCAAFEEWLLLTRERLAQLALRALHTLCEAKLGSGAYQEAERYARRQLELDPWREEAHRQTMQALAASGQRTAALAQYAACSRVLNAELGVEPDIETRALYERIRAGGFSPAMQSAPPHNLPAQLTPFVGREPELAELAARLKQPDVRLQTLAGAGGMGKTRLALEAARAQLAAFPDGVFFVSLAALTDAAAIVPAIATAIGLGQQRGDEIQALLRALVGKRMLLILDNFEHLLDGAGLVVELLKAAPLVRILVTSREPLTVHGEFVQQISALAYAPDELADDAATSDAVVLFAQRARSVRADFRVKEANIAAVLDICRLVGGMPLGLELAAAWTATLPPELIAAELARSVDFLEVDWRDTPRRHQSLRGVFDWSWRLLNATERQVLRGLSVFRGGFTRQAAQSVAGASLGALAALVRKSLLRSGAAGRFEIHEVLRQFAAQQLDAEPEQQTALMNQHSSFYLAFVAHRERRLVFAEPKEAASELRAEIANIRQAWAWAASHGQLEQLRASAFGLRQFYLVTGQFAEGEHIFELAVQQVQTLPDRVSEAAGGRRVVERVLSELLALHASTMLSRNKNAEAIPLARRAIELAGPSESIAGATIGSLNLGIALGEGERYAEAVEHLEHALLLARRDGLSHAPLASLHLAEWGSCLWLATFAARQSDYHTAKDMYTQAIGVCRRRADLRGEAVSLGNLARVAHTVGDVATARQEYHRVLLLARKLGDRWLEGMVQLELGDVMRLQGEYVAAMAAFEHALAVLREIGYPQGETFAALVLGELCCLLGDDVRAHDWIVYALRTSGVLAPGEQLPDAAYLAGTAHAGGDSMPEHRFERLLALAAYARQTGAAEQALAYAEYAWQLAQQSSNRHTQARVLLVLGHARAALCWPGAHDGYQQAQALWEALGNPPAAAEARAGLAALARQAGEPAQALSLVEVILDAVLGEQRVGLDEPFYVFLECYRTLTAVQDPRAGAVARTATKVLQKYAGRITDPSLRRSFLERVALHRELAAEIQNDQR